MKITIQHLVGSLMTISLICLGFIIYRHFDDTQVTLNLIMTAIMTFLSAITIQFFTDIWNN